MPSAKPLLISVNDDLAQIRSDLSTKVNVDEGFTWYALPLNSSLSYTIQEATKPQYCKDQFGIVRLRGYLLKAGGTGIPPEEQFATLPVGFRPRASIYLPISISRSDGGITGGISGTDVFGLRVDTNGVMSLAKSYVFTTYNGGGVGLDNLTFTTV